MTILEAKDKRKSSSSGPALSFADDEEEGEAFVEKKKKKKPAPRPMAPVDTPLETPGALGTGAGVYSAEMLQKLRGEQSFRARPVEEDDSPAVPGDGLPDAEAIGRARAARASARAGGEDDDEAAAGNNDLFIPLERESNTERPSRLVTEEQADEDDQRIRHVMSFIEEQRERILRMAMEEEEEESPWQAGVVDESLSA